MRELLAPGSDPFAARTAPEPFWQRGAWPAHWVTTPGLTFGVVLYRIRFSWPGGPLRLHVSADQRYELFLDGAHHGRGPERGDAGHWRFETYAEDLSAGAHELLARVWFLRDAPHAQVSVKPGFLCAAEGAAEALVTTGIAPWECRVDTIWQPRPKHMVWGTGSKVTVDVTAEPLGGTGWGPVQKLDHAVARCSGQPQNGMLWHLEPATLPPQAEAVVHAGTVCHISDVADDAPLRAADHRVTEAATWQGLLDGSGSVTIPARTRRQILVDLGVYRSAYPEVAGSGNGELEIAWAEALFSEAAGERKDQRDAWNGRWFRGVSDAFRFTGGSGAATTLWWQTGRFVRLTVTTGDAPLTLRSLAWRETGYPLVVHARFASSDARLDAALPLLERVLRRCAHETYMDCPYYEQLQYIGDTRLECLATRAMSRDHRLPEKALASFAWSLREDGLLSSRYPTWDWQNIPTFSLLWLGMVHDAWLLGDTAAVRPHLGAMRAIRERYRAAVRDDGMLGWIPGWNFMDWVPEWGSGGEAPGQLHGTSSVTTWLFAYVLTLTAELEQWAGEPALAVRDRTLAERLAQACDSCWDENRGLYRDAPAIASFSEHAQVLALLSGLVPAARAQRLLDGLTSAPDLARTTVYFSHYLFEVAGRFRRPELLFKRLEYWRALPGQGFTTVPEQPEPSRSDCHAWGAHPYYHLLATVLGIRPATPGFTSVRITPMVGPLTSVDGAWPHTLGDIAVRIAGDHGSVTLPPGLPGTLVLNGREIPVSDTYTW